MDWFFGSWDEDVNVPVAEENEPISSMNPELLAKAENRSEFIDSQTSQSFKMIDILQYMM